MFNMMGSFPMLLAFIPNPIVSLNEAWFLSNTEKVHALFKKIEEVITKVNTYEELFGELKHIIDEFDEVVKEEVIKYIKEMYEQGTLGDIVKEALYEYLSNVNYSKVSELPLTRKQRHLTEFRYTKPANNNQWHKYVMQGCCIYDDGTGILKMSGAFNGMVNSQSQASTNNVQLSTWGTYNDVSSIIDSALNYGMGHANGMTYNPNDGKLYIIGSRRYDSDGNYVVDRNIYRITPTFNNYESKVLIPTGQHSDDIAYYNGKLYYIDDNDFTQADRRLYVKTVDWDTGATEDVCTITLPFASKMYNFDIQNGKIFGVCTNTKDLVVFDLETGDYLWNYKIPLFDYSHRYRVPEIEGISVMPNGDIYLMTWGYDGFTGQCQVMKTQVFKCNYLTNAVYDDEYIKSMVNPTAGNVVYVKCFESGNRICNVNNPDGTNDRPFETINEAIEYINCLPSIAHSRIYVQSNHRFGIFNSTSKSLDIVGDTGAQGTDWGSYWTLGGGFLQGFNNLTIMYFNIRGSSNDTHQKNDDDLYALGFYNSYVKFYYCRGYVTEYETYYTTPIVSCLKGGTTIMKNPSGQSGAWTCDLGWTSNGTMVIGGSCNTVYNSTYTYTD